MFLFDDILKGLGLRKEEIPKGSYLATHAEKFLAALPFPLVACDRNFLILGATPAFIRLFRVDPKDLEGGRTLLQIVGSGSRIIADGKERQIGGLSKIIGQKNPKMIVGNFPKLGPRSFHLYSRKVPPNLLIGFQDVTDEKTLKEKIEKSRHELLSVFDGIDDPMVMIDKKYRIRRINEAMLRRLGESSYRGFIGKACYFKLHGRRERCPGCTANKTFATGKKTSRLGLIEGLPHADEFNYQITSYPLKDPNGSVTGIAEAYRDVTDVKKTEEELYESERSRVMEPLAAGIAHEVRNPLAIIRSTAQYSLGELGGNDTDLRENLQTIIRNTEQANRVISNLLDFAKPNRAEFRIQPLRPLLLKALNLVRARAESQNVRIIRRIPGNFPPFILDGNRFIQAVMNLLINSLDAMPRGGRLEIEANRQNGNRTAKVVIRDSGEGIPEEVLPKILRPFYSTKKSGVGLGLSIAEGIIRSHGGQVQFKSWKGKGTEVTLTLPLRKRRAHLPAPVSGGGGQPL